MHFVFTVLTVCHASLYQDDDTWTAPFSGVNNPALSWMRKYENIWQVCVNVRGQLYQQLHGRAAADKRSGGSCFTSDIHSGSPVCVSVCVLAWSHLSLTLLSLGCVLSPPACVSHTNPPTDFDRHIFDKKWHPILLLPFDLHNTHTHLKLVLHWILSSRISSRLFLFTIYDIRYFYCSVA